VSESADAAEPAEPAEADTDADNPTVEDVDAEGAAQANAIEEESVAEVDGESVAQPEAEFETPAMEEPKTDAPKATGFTGDPALLDEPDPWD
jgi:hypothetical protein